MAKLTISKVMTALEMTGGIKAAAARNLKVGRTTLYRYLQRHPKLLAYAEEIDEEVKDLAEAKILQAIRAGDMPTVRWYLETKGKDRGYTRRVEATGPNGEPIETRQTQPDLSHYTEEELEIMLRAAERKEKLDREKKVRELRAA